LTGDGGQPIRVVRKTSQPPELGKELGFKQYKPVFQGEAGFFGGQ
jgi:hypothetical protein